MKVEVGPVTATVVVTSTATLVEEGSVCLFSRDSVVRMFYDSEQPMKVVIAITGTGKRIMLEHRWKTGRRFGEACVNHVEEAGFLVCDARGGGSGVTYASH